MFELGPDGGDNETDGELLMESDEMPYECGARWVQERYRDKTQIVISRYRIIYVVNLNHIYLGCREKYPMLFDEPVPLQANHWYVAWSRISGPSSDCGSGGQMSITTEDQ